MGVDTDAPSLGLFRGFGCISSLLPSGEKQMAAGMCCAGMAHVQVRGVGSQPTQVSGDLRMWGQCFRGYKRTLCGLLQARTQTSSRLGVPAQQKNRGLGGQGAIRDKPE